MSMPPSFRSQTQSPYQAPSSQYDWLEQKAHLAQKSRIWNAFQAPSEALDILSKVNDPQKRVSDGALGVFDDKVKLLGGAVLASLATLGLSRKVIGIGEFLGFMGFFGAMAVTPKVIHAMVQARTGLNMSQDYLSSRNERRWIFQDPKYMPLHLLSDKEINRVGDRLGVKATGKDRRRIIEERIKQITSQTLTWWMLMAGPATPVLGSLFAHFTESPVKALFNKGMQQIHQSALFVFPKSEKHLNGAINQLVGRLPEAELSRWWEGFTEGIIKKTGLGQVESLSAQKLSSMSSHQILESLTQHFKQFSANTEALEVLTEYLNQEKGHLNQIEEKAQTIIEKYADPSKQHKNYATQRINTARATIAHYETILKEITEKKTLSFKALKGLINNSRIGEIERLIQAGDHEVAEKLAGNSEIFKSVKGFIYNGQFDKAVQALGDSPGNHMETGLKSFMRRKLWRKRVFGGVGGTLLGLTAMYTLFALSGHNKKDTVETLSKAEMRQNFTPELFEAQQKELEVLRILKSQLPAFPNTHWQNNLKRLFHDKQAVIYALNLRSFGAKDYDRDGSIELELGESGGFLSAIKRLDELKQLGVNTIHLLPLNPVGEIKRKGEAGSIYAPSSMLLLNSEYDSPNNQLNVFQEARIFVQEAHKRGINIMVDVPSAAAIDLALTRPDLIATDSTGRTLTPTTWSDIVMFENNKALVDYYDKFFDLMANTLNVDGFRVDVARARPPWFWKHFTEKYPNQAWLAETYTYEDASPLENVPRDKPLELLNAGFDSIYGQLHIFHNMRNADEYHDYLIQANQMFKASGYGKSMIGSFLTHDDEESLMAHGGVINSNLVYGLMATQPFSNPYIMDGSSTGLDRRINIFDYKKAPRGQHPEIGQFMTELFKIRAEHKKVLTLGNYIPIKAVSNNTNGDQIIAFARQYGNKTMLVIANKDVNARSRGQISIPSFLANEPLKNLAPKYGQASQVKYNRMNNKLDINLGPGVFQLFEINTPQLAYYLQAYS